MKKIKFILSVFLLICFVQLNAQIVAKKAASVDERALKASDKLNQILNLSTAQYQKMIVINKDFFVKRDALRKKIKEDVNPTESAYKPQMTALFKQRKKEISALLNTNQIELYKTWRTQNRQQLQDSKPSNETISEEEIDSVEIM